VLACERFHVRPLALTIILTACEVTLRCRPSSPIAQLLIGWVSDRALSAAACGAPRSLPGPASILVVSPVPRVWRWLSWASGFPCDLGARHRAGGIARWHHGKCCTRVPFVTAAHVSRVLRLILSTGGSTVLLLLRHRFYRITDCLT